MEIRTQFSIGQEVWHISANKANSGKVRIINTSSESGVDGTETTQEFYRLDTASTWIPGGSLFASRDQLLASL